MGMNGVGTPDSSNIARRLKTRLRSHRDTRGSSPCGILSRSEVGEEGREGGEEGRGGEGGEGGRGI